LISKFSIREVTYSVLIPLDVPFQI